MRRPHCCDTNVGVWRKVGLPRKLARNRRSVLHILVTTPESLYLLPTADRSREILRTVRTMIVDEATALFVAITASLDRRPLATLLPERHAISVDPAGALRDCTARPRASSGAG